MNPSEWKDVTDLSLVRKGACLVSKKNGVISHGETRKILIMYRSRKSCFHRPPLPP